MVDGVDGDQPFGHQRAQDVQAWCWNDADLARDGVDAERLVAARQQAQDSDAARDCRHCPRSPVVSAAGGCVCCGSAGPACRALRHIASIQYALSVDNSYLALAQRMLYMDNNLRDD